MIIIIIIMRLVLCKTQK